MAHKVWSTVSNKAEAVGTKVQSKVNEIFSSDTDKDKDKKNQKDQDADKPVASGTSSVRNVKQAGRSQGHLAGKVQRPEPAEHPADDSKLASSFSVPAEQLDTSKVLTAGRAFDVSQLDPNVAPNNLVLARRTAKFALVVSQSAQDYWGGAALQFSAVPSAQPGAQTRTAGSGPAAGRSSGSAAPIATYSLPLSFKSFTATSAPVSFQAVVMVLTGLQYQDSTHRFVAHVAVGLRNPDRPEDRSTLANPLKLVIQASDADTVSPAGGVEIAKLGEPQTVEISAAAPTSPFLVTARTLVDEGDRIEIPVEEVQVVVQPAQAAIAGWGLAKTSLQIEVPGLQQGSGSHEVSLSTDRGQIVPTPLVLDAQGRGTAELRSGGTGAATITASGAAYRSGTASVRFRFPAGFLIATLLGAFAGWLAKKRGRNLTGNSCVAALASACILGTAYAIGIHWLAWAPDPGAGEALPFFVAAIGAYSGMNALMKNVAAAAKAREPARAWQALERKAESAVNNILLDPNDQTLDRRTPRRTLNVVQDPKAAAERHDNAAKLAAKTMDYLAASAQLDARAQMSKKVEK